MRCPKCQTQNTSDSEFCKKCATPLPSSKEIPISHTQTLRIPIRGLAKGSTFSGRYEVFEELGRGGMGKVYRVIDREIDEEVALKLLNPEVAADEEIIGRFRNELKFARKITHKNVCRMYHLGEQEGTYYITMEYVPGEDLKSKIRKMGKMSGEEAVSIAKQVCEGLAEAHRLGVVHRDLKPQNIMIDREANVRIMDFGISHSLEAKGVTVTGMMIGTPEYMSPEQVEGKEIDERSDIYALGVIIYEMATGRVPFEGKTPLTIAVKHKTEAPPDPKEINDQIPEDLSRLVLKCMEKDKEKRYQGVKEVFSELSNIERGIPISDWVLPEKKAALEIPKRRFKPFVVPGILLFAALIIIGGYFFYNRILQPSKKGEEEKMAAIPEQIAPKTEALAPQYGNLEIISTPEGAEVYLDDKSEGLTPLKRELRPGTYRIKIKKSPDYEETADVLEVKAGETSSKNYTLAPVLKAPMSKALAYTLRINTIPEGADVRIDGNYKGKAPITIELPRSRCQLKIEKGEEWSTIDEQLNLKSGSNSLHRDLKRIKYSLSIKTNPSEARVLIGDELFGITPVNKLVSVGECNIKIEREGYEIIEQSITIDSDIAKTYDLTKLKPGKIRLKVLPYADVLIDGELIGEVPPIRILEIEAGKHTIEFVSSRLNKNFTIDVEIKAGENIEIRMNMETGESKIMKLRSIQQ